MNSVLSKRILSKIEQSGESLTVVVLVGRLVGFVFNLKAQINLEGRPRSTSHDCDKNVTHLTDWPKCIT